MTKKKENGATKLAIIGAFIVALFVAIIVITNMSNADKMKSNPYDKEDLQQSTIDLIGNKNYSNIITSKDLDRKINSNEKVFAYFFSPECVHCQNYTPTMMAVAKGMGVQVDQLNLLEYNEDFNTYNIEGTPTLVFFDNGKEIDRMVGDVGKEATEEFFTTYKAYKTSLE